MKNKIYLREIEYYSYGDTKYIDIFEGDIKKDEKEKKMYKIIKSVRYFELKEVKA